MYNDHVVIIKDDNHGMGYSELRLPKWANPENFHLYVEGVRLYRQVDFFVWENRVQLMHPLGAVKIRAPWWKWLFLTFTVWQPVEVRFVESRRVITLEECSPEMLQQVRTGELRGQC